MSPAAAAFWSDRVHLLSPCKDVSEVFLDLEAEWSVEDDGELPTADGSPELDPNLEEGECDIVYQGIEICLPLDLFCDSAALLGARELQPELTKTIDCRTRFQVVNWNHAPGVEYTILPLQEFASWSAAAAMAEKVAAARKRLSWAAIFATSEATGSTMEWLSPDLIERVGRAHQARGAPRAGLCTQDSETAHDFFFPPPSPCTWEHTTGWKGSSATATLKVGEGEALSVGFLLRRELCADVGLIDGELFCKDLQLPDGEYVDWDLGRSKCVDMEVTPP